MTENLLGLEFERYNADQARELRDTVEDIYRRSYVEAIASGDLFDTPAEFMNRFDAYTSRDNGFELVIARVQGRPGRGRCRTMRTGSRASNWTMPQPISPHSLLRTVAGRSR